jgi:porin-like protein
MNTQRFKGAVALGSLTATVALLAGLGSAQAQIGSGQGGPPGAAPTGAAAGSFPQSFLIPGTNTSLSLYGKVQLSIHDNWGSIHTSDTTPLPTVGAPGLSSLPLEGPGAAGGTSFNQVFRSIHGGLRAQANSTNFAFETRTPSDLGEIKTVTLVDFGLLAGQGNYTGAGLTATSINPRAGAGNNSIPRIQWAYGTLGPWLIGQYNSAWQDPLLIAPDIGDQAQVGPLQTVNIRRPQIRYTYLMGNGISLSGSLESMNTGALWCAAPSSAATTCIGTATAAPAALASAGSDNTDVTAGGLVNLPTFNFGGAWDQPFGHLMARVGVGRSELRNGSGPPNIFGGSSPGNNVTQWHWAVEGGVMINTWGQDQWRGHVNYSHGLSTYNSDAPAGTVDMVINGQRGQVSSLNELEFDTSYIHRFNPNWRWTGTFGIGFFNKPDAVAGWGNCANSGGAVAVCIPGGTTNAQLAQIEKRHIFAGTALTYSPVPGQVDIKVELDYYDRQVRASNTGATAWAQNLSVAFYW